MMGKMKFALWLALFLVLTYYFGNGLIWLSIKLKPMTEFGVISMKFGVRLAMVWLSVYGAFLFSMGGKR
jgi:hypothetical protein